MTTPLDYRTRKLLRDLDPTALLQALGRAQQPPGAVAKETPMHADTTLVQLMRKAVDEGQAASMGEAFGLVCSQHPDLYASYRAQVRAHVVQKATDPGQIPAWGETPTGQLAPSRTQGHIAYEQVLAQVKAQHPTWSEQECHSAALASDQGKAAMAQHSAEMRQRTRG